MREMLFISHAKPEDNEFALWLSLQLAKEGYPVWCELTKLLCGEKFWDEAQDAIRNKSAKFIFVLSRHSNSKEGTKNELQTADLTERKFKLKDFILPVAVDDLPEDEHHILLQRRNVLKFGGRWTEGLNTLLEKLEKDNVSKKDGFDPDGVSRWWREQFRKELRETDQPEPYLSNYFPIAGLPTTIHAHRVVFPTTYNSGARRQEYLRSLPHPAYLHGEHIISFADTEIFSKLNADIYYTKDNSGLRTKDFIGGRCGSVMASYETARNVVNNLLRIAWDRRMDEKRIPSYTMADGAKCYYFVQGSSSPKRLSFTDAQGKKKRRALAGWKTSMSFKGGEQTERIRHWHFGIRAKPILSPLPAYAMRYHVVFSDDGETPWQDKDQMHKARRSLCADWWNDDWRDRLLAFMRFLSDGQAGLTVPLGPDTAIGIAALPAVFTSPASYLPPRKPVRMEYVVEEADEDVDAEEEEASTPGADEVGESRGSEANGDGPPD